MKGSPKISVIVPIYKIKEEYLRQGIESILEQTYSNLEIILVDDGSPDRSGEICDSYAKEDKRIIVVHQENSGVSAARNAGMELASGEYIAFVDPDDYLDKDFFSILEERIPDTIPVISCCCMIIGGDFTDEDHFFDGDRIFSNQNGYSADAEHGMSVSEKKELFFQLMKGSYGQPGKNYTAIGVPWGKLYRASFLREYEFKFDTTLPRMQDNLFNMYVFNAADKVMYLDEPLYFYRFEHVSDYTKKNQKSYARTFAAVTEARYECLMKTGLMNDPKIAEYYREESLGRLINILYIGMFNIDSNHSFCESRKLAEAVCGKDCYLKILDTKSTDSLNRRVYLFLIRKKMYGILSLGMKWKGIKALKKSRRI